MSVETNRPPVSKGIFGAVVSIAIALAIGAIGAFATNAGVQDWYPTLEKPGFTPPNAVFAPVWTTLYLMMAVAAWRVWRTEAPAADRRRALVIYGVQLALNLAWSVLFFGLRQPGLALADIAALLIALVACAVAFGRIDRLAGLLLIPYIAWVSFASALNFSIWRLN